MKTFIAHIKIYGLVAVSARGLADAKKIVNKSDFIDEIKIEVISKLKLLKPQTLTYGS